MVSSIDKYKFIINELIERIRVFSGFTSEIGFLNGRAGSCLLLYQYSRDFDDKETENYARHLLDEICLELNPADINFDSGLTGIAWMINYLISKKYLEGDSDEVLENMDLVINKSSKNLGQQINSGLYWVSRLSSTNPQIKVQTKNWINGLNNTLLCQEAIRLSCNDIINILYCCYSIRVLGLFPKHITRLIEILSSSLKQIYQKAPNGCEKFMLFQFSKFLPEVKEFMYDGKDSFVWSVTLSDINKLYLYNLLFVGLSFEIPNFCKERIKSLVINSTIVDALFPTANPETIGLKSHIGGFTLTMINFYNNRFIMKSKNN